MSTLKTKDYGLLAAMGGILGGVIGGVVGALRHGGMPPVAEAATGVGIGAALGAGTLMLEGFVADTIVSSGTSAPAAGLTMTNEEMKKKKAMAGSIENPQAFLGNNRSNALDTILANRNKGTIASMG